MCSRSHITIDPHTLTCLDGARRVFTHQAITACAKREASGEGGGKASGCASWRILGPVALILRTYAFLLFDKSIASLLAKVRSGEGGEEPA